jgi:hypothetical protein
VRSRFHVFRSRTCFWGYRGLRVPFSLFAPRTRFRRYRGRRVQFTCFALPDSFSSVPRASGPIFMFCAPGLVFSGTNGVGSRFHVLRSRTHFRRYRQRWDPFSCFAPELVFGGTKGVGTHFSCFARPWSFSAVPSASGPVFMFALPDSFRRCRVPRVSFSCFPCPDSCSAVPRASGPVFIFNVPVLVFGGTEGVGSRFHVLRSRTRFRRYRGRRVSFSCFALPDSFSVVPRSCEPVFMFSAPGHVFGDIEGVGFLFHILRSRTHFRRYRGRRVQLTCFALPDSFSSVPRASGPVFLFCTPGLVFDGFECVGSRFRVLRARTHFRRSRASGPVFMFERYRGRRVPFSCIPLPDSFSATPMTSGPVFMFRSRTCFRRY